MEKSYKILPGWMLESKQKMPQLTQYNNYCKPSFNHLTLQWCHTKFFLAFLHIYLASNPPSFLLPFDHSLINQYIFFKYDRQVQTQYSKWGLYIYIYILQTRGPSTPEVFHLKNLWSLMLKHKHNFLPSTFTPIFNYLSYRSTHGSFYSDTCFFIDKWTVSSCVMMEYI